ncbi:MAG TPA: hypothetical protein VGJ03_15225 [Acidimicrobiales bacterium]
MLVRTRIILGTLCTFNAMVLLALGALSLRFVDGDAGPIGATLFWAGAISLLVIAHRLRRDTDW